MSVTGVSSRGYDLIRKDEDFRSKAYIDPGGVWTIGYGWTQGVKPGDTMTKEEAEHILQTKMQSEYQILDEVLNQNQVDALSSFSWNAGPGRARKALNLYKSNGTEAMASFMRTIIRDKKGKVLKGLVDRREREIALFMSNDDFSNIARTKNNTQGVVQYGQDKTRVETYQATNVDVYRTDPETGLQVPVYSSALRNIQRHKDNASKLSRL